MAAFLIQWQLSTCDRGHMWHSHPFALLLSLALQIAMTQLQLDSVANATCCHCTTVFYFLIPRAHSLSKEDKWTLNSITFKAAWSVDYFVIELNGKALCLLYNNTVSVLKERNIYQLRLSSHHSIPNSKESNSQKKNSSGIVHQNFLTKIKNENEIAIKGFLVSHLLAKESCLLMLS